MEIFKKALPIFPRDKSREMNTFAYFSTQTESLKGAKMRLAACTFYRLFVNGEFVAFGPARTAKGYARVDEIVLDGYHEEGGNQIVVEVAGYYCSSLSTVLQPSFFCAEIYREDEVLAASGYDFNAYLPSYKVRKTKRYSFQRHFTEIWDYSKGFTPREYERAEIEVCKECPRFLVRGVPYPRYEQIEISSAVATGSFCFDEAKKYRTDPYSISPIPVHWNWGVFEDSEIERFPFVWAQRRRQTPERKDVKMPIALRENEYALVDFSRIEAGFLRLSLAAREKSEIVVAFSESGDGETFTFPDMDVDNTLEFILPEGENISLASFEPYSFKYVCVFVKSGNITLRSVGCTTYEYDVTGAPTLESDNETLNSIYRGALRSFAHNAVDVYTDCPSRERGGWLCDSYFTAQTEYELFGRTPVEEGFLENYRLYPPDGSLPSGMIPMCYPADIHKNGDGMVAGNDSRYIPQWAMWYVMEVADYLTVRNPAADREKFRASLQGLLDFFKGYENSDGLLERLPSWNFVEWSEANHWTWDVNYPTNFLYAKVLESFYRIYGDEKALARSKKVAAKAIEQSFNGRYFCDHAKRQENGELVLQKHSSEACQYYAILFSGMDIREEKYRELYRLVTQAFGAVRREPVPEIIEVNAFMGAYLRLETLLKLGENELALRDVEEFFGKMEKRTGTLWEYRSGIGSRDQGFASYALVVIRKALRISSR